MIQLTTVALQKGFYFLKSFKVKIYKEGQHEINVLAWLLKRYSIVMVTQDMFTYWCRVMHPVNNDISHHSEDDKAVSSINITNHNVTVLT